ncbi:response regulator [Phycicoccus endophyticus]|uniref:Transcriptional regulatory protein n=1 Tax=Phycicoccus endophyticus TaxID=1690220 RepID=A0A7G9R0J8_9MICO|nr:response regulator [Phycicoccus endophyticus]NHI19401.1 response regulator [Phycicoccus endophyticus]QNN49123.1 response regulator [Phycicoccus endophyticus]GGL38784.1 transcriptional regulatory protein [Phycicoccus endophyticus]
MSDTAAQPIRVLVVEDDEVAARAHATYVERVPGFVVAGVAHTARAALRGLGEGSVDLVLLDMGLPDAPGLDVVRAMRAAGHRADVVAVTSARDLEMVRAAVSLGVVQYVLKPFVFGTLWDRLAGYRVYREQASAGEADTQAEVDTLFSQLRPTAGSAVPKGMTPELLGRTAAALRAADGPRSAAELGEQLGVSRVTARRYLEHLVGTGRASRGNRYAGSGRPEVAYSWQG